MLVSSYSMCVKQSLKKWTDGLHFTWLVSPQGIVMLVLQYDKLRWCNIRVQNVPAINANRFLIKTGKKVFFFLAQSFPSEKISSSWFPKEGSFSCISQFEDVHRHQLWLIPSWHLLQTESTAGGVIKYFWVLQKAKHYKLFRVYESISKGNEMKGAREEWWSRWGYEKAGMEEDSRGARRGREGGKEGRGGEDVKKKM